MTREINYIVCSQVHTCMCKKKIAFGQRNMRDQQKGDKEVKETQHTTIQHSQGWSHTVACKTQSKMTLAAE